MTMERLIAGLLALAVLIAAIRLILWHRSAPGASALRLIALLLPQPLCATLLFLTLYPPPVAGGSASLRIATAGASRLAVRQGGGLVALPEAGTLQGAEAAPDLATALRRHPGARQVSLLGEGLPPRDIDAARGVQVSYDPPAPPTGLVSLTPPPAAAPGEAFTVGGQIAGLPGASIALIDPAGRITDSGVPDRQGRFRLTGTARAAGNSLFTLRIMSGKRLAAQAAVPLTVRDVKPPRLLLLAGAPGPEVKYLRRWATDAGFDVTSRISVGGGVLLGDAPISIDTATLRRFDAVLIDDRSWAGLGGQRNALLAAVRDGLGLILRAGGPLDGTTRAQWRGLGFALSGNNVAAPLALPKPPAAAMARTRQGIASADMPDDMRLPADFIPDVSRLALSPAGDQAVTLLRDASGTPLAAWHAAGLGRVALFTGLDSYALALTGHGALYDDWWRALLRAVVRPAPGSASLPGISWAGERLILCGIGGDAQVERPDGAGAALQQVGACAAFWPATAGWHRLHDKGAATPFYVQPADALPAMRAARNRDATLMLRSTAPRDGGISLPTPGPAWPFALAWLIASALLWWFERSRLGRDQPTRSTM